MVNNIVQFSTSSIPAVTGIPSAAAPLSGVPVEKAVPTETGATKAVTTALGKVGSTYKHAQSGPNSFDCSGLTSYAWREAGVTLPRNSRSQFSALDWDTLNMSTIVTMTGGGLTVM